MALSGTTYKNIGAHWRLSISWTASQSTSGNYSTVTARMYWEALDGYGRVNSSGPQDGAIYIDGTEYKFSGNGLAALSPNQKKLLVTKSKTIKHNNNGTKSFSIRGYFNAKVTLGSTYYNKDNCYVPSKSYTLHTIPRLSTMTSSPNFTAGTDRSISISRQSSSFKHRLYIDVKGSNGEWKNIKAIDFSTSETSKSTSFSVKENREIFYMLDKRSSMDVRWNLRTISGDDSLGYSTSSGKIRRPNLSTVSSTNGQAGGSNNFYIDQEMSVGISRSNSGFTHTVSIECGSFKKTLTGVSTSFKWIPSASERASLAAQMPNASSKAGTINITTYYDGSQIVGSTEHSIKFYVRESSSKPDFSGNGVHYLDTNPATVEITSDSSYLIQGYSTLRVEIPKEAMATPKNGATIDYYAVTVNGVTKKANYVSNESIAIDFGAISSSDVTTITVKVVDSRGFSTSIFKNIKMIPYASPVVSTNAKRINGFEQDTTLTLKGSVSPISVNGKNRNSVEIARYRYKKSEASSFGGWQAFSLSGFPNYVATNVTLVLETDIAFEVEVEVSDMLTSTTKRIVVPAGRPIMFLDPDRRSVGFFDFPDGDNEIKVNGRIIFGNTAWQTSNQGEGMGALHLNNSDVTGINGLWFNDVAQPKNGEGLLFLKSDRPSGSSNVDDYDSFSIRNGVVTFNAPKSKITIDNNVDLNGGTLSNAYAVSISGPGGDRGIQFLNGSGWKIVEAPNNLAAQPGPLQLALENNRLVSFTRTGSIYITGPNIKGESGETTTFGSIGEARLSSDKGAGAYAAVTRDSEGDRFWSPAIYTRKMSGSANVLVTSNGTLRLVSSASRFKSLIEEVDTDKIAKKILYLDPKSWYDKSMLSENADYLSRMYNGDLDSGGGECHYLERTYGLIAEDLLDCGLGMFVNYGPADENGKRETMGISYDRLWTLLIPLVRDHEEKVHKLEDEIKKLKEQLGGQ